VAEIDPCYSAASIDPCSSVAGMTAGETLVSIVVPVFNEAGTVAAVIERLLTIEFSAPRESLSSTMDRPMEHARHWSA
jgi:hypothetical protein